MLTNHNKTFINSYIGERIDTYPPVVWETKKPGRSSPLVNLVHRELILPTQLRDT